MVLRSHSRGCYGLECCEQNSRRTLSTFLPHRTSISKRRGLLYRNEQHRSLASPHLQLRFLHVLGDTCRCDRHRQNLQLAHRHVELRTQFGLSAGCTFCNNLVAELLVESGIVSQQTLPAPHLLSPSTLCNRLKQFEQVVNMPVPASARGSPISFVNPLAVPSHGASAVARVSDQDVLSVAIVEEVPYIPNFKL